jgi:putative membrane protein
MRIASYIGLIVGLGIFIALLVWQGFGDLADLLLATGWPLLFVPVIWFPTVLMNARCWQVLFVPPHGPTFGQAFHAQWMGRAVNTLLPVASIGGEIVKARALILWGIDAKHASASAVVDKTIQALTMIVWGVVGIGILASTSLDNELAYYSLLGLAILGAGIAGFLVVQRAGMFRIILRSAQKVTGSDKLGKLVGTAEEVDEIVRALYRDRARVFRANGWRLAALVLQTGEVWLAAMLLGFPVGILEALMLKSLSSTLSDVAFVVPNSYGIQEGAFIVLGALVGLEPDAALAISLAIRIREVLIDVPGLVLWQHAEGRAFFRRRRGNRDAGPST